MYSPKRTFIFIYYSDSGSVRAQNNSWVISFKTDTELFIILKQLVIDDSNLCIPLSDNST